MHFKPDKETKNEDFLIKSRKYRIEMTCTIVETCITLPQNPQVFAHTSLIRFLWLLQNGTLRLSQSHLLSWHFGSPEVEQVLRNFQIIVLHTELEEGNSNSLMNTERPSPLNWTDLNRRFTWLAIGFSHLHKFRAKLFSRKS